MADIKEDDDQVVATVSIRTNKAKPGMGFLNFGKELLEKMNVVIPDDGYPLLFRYDKHTHEMSLKPLEY